MTSKILLEVLKKIIAACRRQKIKIAVMGGIAASVFGRPRTTYDLDAFILIEEAALTPFLKNLAASGFDYNRKQPVKNIQGMPFITLVYQKLETYVDLFLARSEFHKEILKRARKIKLNQLEIPLVCAEDLVLLKLLSGRGRDLEDIREILKENKKKLDLNYLMRWSKKLEVDLFLRDELESLGWKK